MPAQDTVPSDDVNMADRPVSPLKPEESVAQLENTPINDDEDTAHSQETGRVSPLGHETPLPAPTSVASPKPRVSFSPQQDVEAPPPKPPRPANAHLQAEITLIEAFPSIDAKVVKAVLAASSYRVEPAFNALLGMTDPESQQAEEEAPPPPPRPSQTSRPQNQLEEDERYARRLAEHYNSSTAPPRDGGNHHYNQREAGRRQPNQQPRRYNEQEDEDRNFFDDDLPEIGKTIQQGFVETQKKVYSLFNTIRKRIDGDEEDGDEDLYTSSQPSSRQNTQRQDFGASTREQLYGIRKGAEGQQQNSRRSTEAGRYDADPHELGDDAFERLELRDYDDVNDVPPPQPPRTSSRQKANPDLFKAVPKPPQSGPVDEVDAFDRSNPGEVPDDGKARKWQPLTSAAPTPEDDNDPFALGDDEEDKTEDLRKEDTERLKQKARASVSAGTSGAKLEENERSGSVGTRDKVMDDLLSGKKDEKA